MTQVDPGVHHSVPGESSTSYVLSTEKSKILIPIFSTLTIVMPPTVIGMSLTLTGPITELALEPLEAEEETRSSPQRPNRAGHLS